MDEKPEPKELYTIQCDRQLYVTRFSPCGKYLLGGGYDSSIRRWNITGQKPQQLDNLKGHHGWVTGAEFVVDSDLLITVDSWGKLQASRYGDDPVVVWENEHAHDGWIRALSLSSDGTMIATGGRDRCVRLWSTRDGKLLHEISDQLDEVYAVAIHPDKQTVVTGDLFGMLRCWDLTTRKCVGEKKLEKMHFHERIQDVGGLRLLRFHDAETLICGGADPQRAGRSIAIPTIHWLNWPSLEIRSTARFGPEKHGFVFDLKWHPDGYWAIVTSGQPGNGQFILLHPGEQEPFFVSTKMSNCHSVDVHPDGRLVVAASNRNSQGNGAIMDKQGNYLGNYSPLHFFSPPRIKSAETVESSD